MRRLYSFAFAALCQHSRQALLGLSLGLLAGPALAQPTITGSSPARNTHSAARATSVAVTFSETMKPSANSSLRVYSSMAGGRKAGLGSLVGGNTVSFNPAVNFRAGETVMATVRTTAQNLAGVPLAAPRVYQFTTATAPSTGTFNGGADVLLPNTANGMAVGDLTGDGVPDLVSSLGSSNRVELRAGYGDGTFGPAVVAAALFKPADLVLADVNKDGKLDLLAASDDDNLVRVFTNNGTGTLTAAGSVAMGNKPGHLTLGDLDGDDDLDLVATDEQNETVVTRLNNGSGSFAGGTTLAFPGYDLTDVALADVNSDGDLDLLVAGYDNTPNGPSDGALFVRRNNGSGSFSGTGKLVTNHATKQLAVGDLDGDGDLDVAIANGDKVVVARNDGSGTFTASSTIDGSGGVYNTGIEDLALSDLDGDGDLDLVFLQNFYQMSNSRAQVLRNNGAGTFAGVGAAVSIGRNPDKLALADLDDDGDLDLLVQADSYSSGKVSVRLNEDRFAVLATRPAPGYRRAPTGTNVALTFNAAVGNASASQVRVFGGQAGGRKAGTYAVSDSLLTFDPTTDFRAGELVQVSVPGTVLSGTGQAARPHVLQFTGAATGGQGTFTSAPTVPVGTQPMDGTLADINGDGHLDLLVANTASASLAVRLGDGLGGFSGGSLATSANAGRIRAADIDGDGDLDLLAVVAGNLVNVFRNNGTGTFAAAGSVPVGNSPKAITVADVDGDGDLDLLTANRFGATVSLRLNDGTGSFGGGTELPTGVSPSEVVAADLNNDGDLDLLVSNANGNSVSIFFNDGAGNFAVRPALAVGAGPQMVAAGDLDGDGDVDFVTADADAHTVSVCLNNGQGSFSLAATLPAPQSGAFGPVYVVLGDADGDGDLDLLIDEATVVLRRNNGFATYGAATTVSALQAFGLAWGDLDNDGDLDFVVTDNSAGSVAVRLNQDAFRVTAVAPARNLRNAPAGSDVELTFSQNINGATANRIRVFGQQGQGRKAGVYAAAAKTLTFNPTQNFKPGELVNVTVPTTVVSSGANQPARHHVYQFTVAAGVGPGTFAAAPTVPVSDAYGAVALGDVNGDGSLDLFGTDYTTHTVSLYLGAGDGTFGPGTAVSPGNGHVYALSTADMDGDGDLDLVVGATFASEVRVHLNNGSGSFGPASVLSLPGLVYAIALGDVDGDSDLDLLTIWGIYLNNGSGTLSFGSNISVVGILGVALGDMDGDGDLDAVSTGSVRFNNGQGVFGGGYDFPYGGQANGTLLGDLDGDGDLDLVVPAAYSPKSVWIYLNDGQGLFGPPTVILTPDNQCYEAALADMDGDGDLDILLDGDAIGLLRNDGSGGFAAPEQTAAAGGWYLATGDLDNDGDLDYVAVGDDGFLVRLNGTPLLVTALSPTRNQRQAPAASSVAVTSNQAMSNAPASVAGVKVFSSQRGGLLNSGGGGTGVAAGNTITFDPTTNFRPGETVQVTVTSAATSNGNLHLAAPHVYHFTAAAGVGPATFAAAPDVAVVNTSTLALADVNADGDLDLFLSSFQTQAVTLHLGNGNGGFGAGVVISNGISWGVALATPDLDNDGDLDLLVLDRVKSQVSVHFNDGLGGYGQATTTATSSQPNTLAVGDVDGDGDLDFVTAGAQAITAVWLNDGSGIFSQGTGTTTNGINGLALGDMDGDGDLDLVTARSVRFNNGLGVFGGGYDFPSGGNPNAALLGDLDGDGDLDLVVPNADDQTVWVRLNDGSGILSAELVLAAPLSIGYDAALGDVDGDGDLDILVDGAMTTLLRNNGNATFAASTTTSTPDGYILALGDVDNDGDLDFVTGGNGSVAMVRLNEEQLLVTGLSPTRNRRNAPAGSNIEVTFNQNISPAAASVSAVRVFSTQRGLLNGGGGVPSGAGNVMTFNPTKDLHAGETVFTTITTDATAANGITTLARPHVYQFTVAATGGSGTFVPGADLGSGFGHRRSAVGDLDGDGDVDIVTTNTNSNSITIWLNDGNATYTATSVPAGLTSPEPLVLADMDGDGDLDLLLANATGTVQVRPNNGTGTFGAGLALTSLLGARNLAVGDVDGDGDLDLGVAYGNGTSISLHLNNGGNTFLPANALTMGAAPGSIAFGDVDGDGDLDVLTADIGSNTVTTRLNNGSGTFGPASSVSVAASPADLTLGDVDGDGDLDVVTVGTGTSTASVRLNDGSGVFSGTTSPALPSNSRAVALADVDGDGDLDLLAATSAGSGSVSVCRNNGDGTFGSSAETTLPGIPSALVVADVDGDGDLDWVGTGVGVMGPAGAGMQLQVCVRLNQNAGPLPVELTTFTAERRADAALLRWRTASEKNNAGFTVESSTDGRAFQPLGFVPGQGSSAAAHAYEFADQQLLRYGTRLVYYRLRQQDQDGRFTYSPVRTLALAGTQPAEMALYPNPAPAGTPRTLLGAPAQVPIALVDALGREVFHLTSEPAGATQLALPAHLAPGVYVLRLPGQALRLVITEK